jgi:hypothetical protein
MKPNNLRSQSFSSQNFSFEFTLFSDLRIELQNQGHELLLNLFDLLSQFDCHYLTMVMVVAEYVFDGLK